ncbi:MAG: alpha/beta hydrolase [Candidatus Azobacteroides sp.]|nr:alpha/beta hydrolase [Candidatus Azobacteroides sp.]
MNKEMCDRVLLNTKKNYKSTESQVDIIKSSLKFLLLLFCLLFIKGTDNQLAAQEKVPAIIVETLTDSTLRKNGYVNIEGLEMYYEIHGEGRPLVLLHGGMMDLTFWGSTLTKLAQSRQVIVFDMEGHGRTADLDRPLTWEQITDDVAAAVTKLGYEKVDVMGYSLGGVVALRMGMKYPGIVRKLVIMSGIYSAEGYYLSIRGHWPSAEQLAGSPQQKQYAKVAPDPSHWPVFIGKVLAELNNFKGWSDSEVLTVKAPVLLIFGDNDAVMPEHGVHLFRLLGGDKAQGGFTGPLSCQLAVLPNTTHFDIYTKADLFIPMVNPFLDAEIAE